MILNLLVSQYFLFLKEMTLLYSCVFIYVIIWVVSFKKTFVSED